MFQLWLSFDVSLYVVSCGLVQCWFSFGSDLFGHIVYGSALVHLVLDSLLMVQLWFRQVVLHWFSLAWPDCTWFGIGSEVVHSGL